MLSRNKIHGFQFFLVFNTSPWIWWVQGSIVPWVCPSRYSHYCLYLDGTPWSWRQPASKFIQEDITIFSLFQSHDKDFKNCNHGRKQWLLRGTYQPWTVASRYKKDISELCSIPLGVWKGNQVGNGLSQGKHPQHRDCHLDQWWLLASGTYPQPQDLKMHHISNHNLLFKNEN